MRLLQLNLNHCQATPDLLSQIVCETFVDVAIISEQYSNMQSTVWTNDSSNKAAIWACGNKAIEEISKQKEYEFVRAKIGGIYIYSCYAPPSATIEQYQNMLDRLVRDSDRHSPKIIAGDFNAWAVEWGSRFTNRRGRILLEAFSGHDLVLTNNGNLPKFTARGTSSVVDLTFLSSSLSRNVDWRVSDLYTHSDHQAILFSICNNVRTKNRSEAQFTGWAFKKLDKELFVDELSCIIELDGTAKGMSEKVTEHLKRACDSAMPRRRLSNNCQTKYWWNDEISKLRKMCLKARRQAQRSRGRINFEECCREHQILRRKFQQAIVQSKAKCFKQICMEADTDPWGKASKLKGQKSPQPTCPNLMKRIVETLFPLHRSNVYPVDVMVQTETIPPVTEEELFQIVNKIGDRKAPGPDNFPNIILKLAIRMIPNIFVKMFTQCLKEAVFPDP